MRGLFTGAVLLFLCVLGICQSPAEPYRLQIEDQIRIQVFNQQQISADVPVGRDGNISAPFVGQLKAAGRTIDEITDDLTKLYAKRLRLRDPIVSVTLVRLRDLRATIGGAVLRPGTITFRPGDTILKLLNEGGGAIRDVADLRRAYLRRDGSTEVIPIDLYAMTVYGDLSQNYPIRDGDELMVPETQRNQIIVSGAIQRPGVFPYREPLTLADAIALAGGEIRYRSRFSKTLIIRQKNGLPGEYIYIQANFVNFVKKQDVTQNVVLQPGDFVYIPETNTPDFQQISYLANSFFVLDSLGRVFGIRTLNR